MTEPENRNDMFSWLFDKRNSAQSKVADKAAEQTPPSSPDDAKHAKPCAPVDPVVFVEADPAASLSPEPVAPESVAPEPILSEPAAEPFQAPPPEPVEQVAADEDQGRPEPIEIFPINTAAVAAAMAAASTHLSDDPFRSHDELPPQSIKAPAPTENLPAPVPDIPEPPPPEELVAEPEPEPEPETAPSDTTEQATSEPATIELATTTEPETADEKPDDVLLPINAQEHVIEALTKIRREPRPRVGMAALELAPPRLRQADIVTVTAGGHRVTARIREIQRTYAYSLRPDGTYRLDGAMTKTSPRLILDIDVETDA